MAKVRRLVPVVVLLAGVLLGGRVAAAADEPTALHQVGRWLVDADGRAVVLHGVNQLSKLPPFLPSALGFGEDDVAYIASQGFNTVRTGLLHQAFAPAPGVYDTTYLDDVAATVALLSAHGIYTLLDFHQDLYGARYQGEGVAAWATVDSSPVDPTLFPNCAAGFPANLFACEFLWEAFDRLLGLAGRSAEIGPRGLTLQQELADAWRPVALRFRDDPLVFGYDLFNEPYPGSATLACLNTAGCPLDADAKLTAFSNLLAAAVREVDPDGLVFYEPFGTNFNAGFPTNHGDVDASGVGFSFHLYACPTTPGPATLPAEVSEACRSQEQQVFSNAEARAETFGHVPLLTEFGATDDLPSLARLAELADANMMGWQYWAWWNRDPCCDRSYEGLIDDPLNPPTSAHLDEPKLDVLVRPFPRAVAGTPIGWSWDRVARRFALAYATDRVGGGLPAAGARTEVWVPRRHFPDGYDVVDLQGAQVVSPNDAEALQLIALPGAAQVSFAVVPPRCGPAPAAGCRRPVQAGGSVLALTDAAADDKDRLGWTWAKGAVTPRAAFGTPTATTDYQLCIYDETAGTSRLALAAAIPAGGTCGRSPCWRATSTGFTYANRGGAPDGVSRVVLKEGTVPGRAKIQLRARGLDVAMPRLPLSQDPAVTVQLRNSDGACWEARYPAPATRNRSDRFKDRGE